MGKKITPEWINWIKLNIQRGCDKDGIFKILLDEGFSRDQIVAQMNYEPVIDPSCINNPLALLAERQPEIAQDGDGFSRKVKLDGTKIHLPNSLRLNTDLAEFHLVEDFLNRPECQKLARLIKSSLRASEIAGKELDSNYRTSSTCDLGNLDDPFIQDIDRRICNMIGIDASYSEVIQGQYYQVGQEFKSRTDYFEADQFEQYAADRGQRTYTFFIYLNDVEEGGETEFSRLGVEVQPKQGRALIWNSLNPQGMPNPNTVHQAHPVLRGEKYVITKWFRANGAGPMYTKESNEFIPNYTKEGFKKSRLEPQLYKKLAHFYQENQQQSRDEKVDGGFVHSDGPCEVASTVVELPEELRNEIHSSLQPKLSKWSGVELKPTYVYGIRAYHGGAILEPHRDRLRTHIIGAIINVDQKANKRWPLLIQDNFYRFHNVYLEPGEIVYYESARLTHGRPEAFDGERFANIFCHYMPQWR